MTRLNAICVLISSLQRGWPQEEGGVTVGASLSNFPPLLIPSLFLALFPLSSSYTLIYFPYILFFCSSSREEFSHQTKRKYVRMCLLMSTHRQIPHQGVYLSIYTSQSLHLETQVYNMSVHCLHQRWSRKNLYM